MRITWLLFLCLLVFFGCTSVHVTEGEGKAYRHFGYIEVFVPETDERIGGVKIQSIGVFLETGISIGWRDEELVWVPLKTPEGVNMPQEATCSVVMIIRSDAQAQHASEILTNIEEKNICLVSFQ